jgi:transketolase
MLTYIGWLKIEDLKNFRQLGSLTPGHPERNLTPGIEATTGPLGQGVGNAVGMAVAECILREHFGEDIMSHYTYCLHGDGDIQEPVAQGAIAIAGHW